MAEKIPYVKWRERINQIVPDEYRIGNDVFILPQHKLFQLPEGHFKTDVTTVIIYEKGWVRVSIDMREYMVQAPSVVTFLPETIYKVLECSEDLEYKIVIYSKNFTDNLFLNLDRMHPLRSPFRTIRYRRAESTCMYTTSTYRCSSTSPSVAVRPTSWKLPST